MVLLATRALLLFPWLPAGWLGERHGRCLAYTGVKSEPVKMNASALHQTMPAAYNENPLKYVLDKEVNQFEE